MRDWFNSYLVRRSAVFRMRRVDGRAWQPSLPRNTLLSLASLMLALFLMPISVLLGCIAICIAVVCYVTRTVLLQSRNQQLVACADAALYNAKLLGRGRAEVQQLQTSSGLDTGSAVLSFDLQWFVQAAPVPSAPPALCGIVGAGDRDRTGDIQLGKLTFCH